MQDFVMLGRSYFSHPLWAEDRVFSRAEAWLDLIQLAAFTAHRRLIGGVIIEVPRGGIVASVRFLSDRWKWSNTKVCAYLEMIKTEQMVSVEKRQGISVISLCNFDRFNPEKRRGNGTETTGERREDDEENKVNKGETYPPNPRKRGRKEGGAKPSTPEALALSELFRRRPDTEWSAREVKAFRSARPTLADIETVAGYYAAERAKGPDGIHRRDLLTLLNNWPGELDRAQAAGQPVNGRSVRDLL